MEIERDALLRVIKATRLALRLAENTRKLMADKGGTSIAEVIAGDLSDALFLMSNEPLAPTQDFETDSHTMEILRSSMSDETVADLFEVRSRVFKRVQQMQQEEQKQPKPKTMERPEFMDLYKRFGGYSTPEGEW